MEIYYIIGRANTVCDDDEEDEMEDRPRRATPKKVVAKSSHYRYTKQEAIDKATCRARNDECDYVIYKAVKLVAIEKAPVKVSDLT